MVILSGFICALTFNEKKRSMMKRTFMKILKFWNWEIGKFTSIRQFLTDMKHSDTGKKCSTIRKFPNFPIPKSQNYFLRLLCKYFSCMIALIGLEVTLLSSQEIISR